MSLDNLGSDFYLTLLFIFPLFLGMVMYANEKRKGKLKKINSNKYKLPFAELLDTDR